MERIISLQQDDIQKDYTQYQNADFFRAEEIVPY